MLDEKKQKMISASLNSFNKINIFEKLEQKKHKEKTKQEL
jgi:hypothetical protein